jgi:hypothetical protein
VSTREELQRKLDEKLQRIHDLRLRKPKKHCGHKEYSSVEDVETAMRIERLQEEVSALRAHIAGLSKG